MLAHTPGTPTAGRKQKRHPKLVALDNELVNLDHELAAVAILADTEMKMHPRGGGELAAALMSVRVRASAMEARRGVVLSDISHYQSMSEAPLGGRLTGAGLEDDVGWRLAAAVTTTQVHRAQHQELDLKLQTVFASAADVARAAISTNRAKGKTGVPLLDSARCAFSTAIYTRGCHWFPRLLASSQASRRVTNGIALGGSLLLPVCTVNCVQTLKALHSVSGLIKEMDTKHMSVLDAEQRADTQVVITLRQAGVDSTDSGGNNVEPALEAITVARKARDGVVGKASLARTKYVALLGELRESLQTQASTALTFADVEAIRAEQKLLVEETEEAAQSIAAAEMNGTAAVLKTCIDSSGGSNRKSTLMGGVGGTTASGGKIAAYAPHVSGVMLHKFDGNVDNGQLIVERGQAVTVVDQVNDDWYYCTTVDGSAGLVPCTFVKSDGTITSRCAAVADGGAVAGGGGGAGASAGFGAAGVTLSERVEGTPEGRRALLLSPTATPDEYMAPVGREIDDASGPRFQPATPALELAYRSALLPDVVDEFSALQRHETAVSLVEELRYRRTAELREVWTLSEERRALEAALRCAEPGQFSPARDRLSTIAKITEQAHQHCKLIASAMAPASARLGRTAQIHHTQEVLQGFAPTSAERLTLLVSGLGRVRRQFNTLDSEWIGVQQGWSESDTERQRRKKSKRKRSKPPAQSSWECFLEEAPDLLETTRIHIEAAKAVVSKGEDAVAREVLRIAATPPRALDLTAGGTGGGGDMPSLIDATIGLKKCRILEKATHELLDEKALLLANLLDEERMRLLRSAELAQQELAALQTPPPSPSLSPSPSFSPEAMAMATMIGQASVQADALKRAKVIEAHLVDSKEIVAVLDAGVETAARTSREAQDSLALLSAKDDPGAEVGTTAAVAVVQTPTYVLSKIMQGAQRLRLQEARLSDRFLQAGVIDLARLEALPDAIRASGYGARFSTRNLHSRMPLVPTPARLKLLHACDQ
jgi:hypothetical protein